MSGILFFIFASCHPLSENYFIALIELCVQNATLMNDRLVIKTTNRKGRSGRGGNEMI